MLVLEKIAKRYGRRDVLHGIDAAFAAGRMHVVMGPNGAGKTTLVKCILGLVDHRGAVTWNGQRFRPEQRVVCPVFDTAPFHPQLSGRQNLRVLAPSSLDGSRRYVDETLLSRRVAGYSHGERMRLALHIALNDPAPVLVLDEPTNGLDREAMDRLSQDLIELRGEKTVLLTGHSLEFYERLADTVTVLNGGQVVAALDGKERSLVEYYETYVHRSDV